MPLSDIFKRQNRREDAIARAEYEQVTGKKAPPPAPVAPVKRDPVKEMDAARDRAFGIPKQNTRARSKVK